LKGAERLNLSKNMELFERAKDLIPGGVVGARHPRNFIEGEYPIFLESGKGGRVWDIDGNEYIDLMCGYGPISLGYREKEVDDAVIEMIREKGFCFSITPPYQPQLAEKLQEVIPCCERSIFTKTGSDAMTAAVRIARAYTNRIKVIRCGFHGWHDWCVEVKGGIPEKLHEDVYEFRYNDLDQLEDLMKKHGDDTAAITLTPFGHPLHEKMQEPAPGFLEGVRELATKYGTVLIFDEIRTCFRLRLGGAQELYGVVPDLAVVGKGMANGYAIAAVTGKAEIMKVIAEGKVFVSSTYFGNSDGYVAALKTIEIMERENVIQNIWEKGNRFLDKLRDIIGKYNVGAELSGVAPMYFITFKRDKAGLFRKRRTDFYTQLIRRGVFLAPYHHGYICYRHTEEDLEIAAKAVDEALAYVQEKYGDFEED